MPDIKLVMRAKRLANSRGQPVRIRTWNCEDSSHSYIITADDEVSETPPIPLVGVTWIDLWVHPIVSKREEQKEEQKDYRDNPTLESFMSSDEVWYPKRKAESNRDNDLLEDVFGSSSEHWTDKLLRRN